MGKAKKAIIIGSGIGGIVTAGSLARKGYDVALFEKNAHPGGRCGTFMKEGHRFDIGATFMMMPGVYKEAFSALGKSMTDELTLYRMDPVYRVKFPGDKEISFSSDMAKLQDQFEQIEKGSYGRFLKLMSKGLTDDVSDLMGNASSLLESLTQMSKTKAGVGMFLIIVAFVLFGVAYYFISRII